ncbi:MAG TPA: patatin-like phospholipase family protein [Vicinamibacteria bacterium]
MRDYSPKRRTALVFTGSGTTGAYHAGALRALDECGVKIDLVVGSGIGAVSAAYAAVGGGPRLYGPGGFWEGARRADFYRLRPTVRIALGLLSLSFAIFALPVLLGLLLGVLFPLLLIADRVFPGVATRALGLLWVAPEALSGPYLAAQAVPVFALAMLAIVGAAALYLRDRRRFAESFESFLDPTPGLARLRRGLWEIARGAALSASPPSDAELSRRYVELLSENLGEPGFREVLLRAADLDRGAALSFAVRPDEDGEATLARDILPVVDLRAPGHEALFFDAVATGLLCPMALPLRRVSFPRGAAHAGEIHRLTDASLVGGSGIAEAIAAGAEQVVVVTGVPEIPAPLARRRGPLARVDAAVRALERQAAADVAEAGRTGRVDLWVIRPEARALGPVELDGALDPVTEVRQTTDDLLELGFRDAYRQFVGPVVGQAPIPEREEGRYRNTQPVGL